MELKILGHWAGAPMEGGATSSYLIADGDTRLLLDCGSGALSLLQKSNLAQQLDGIVISHMHADHYLDLVPYTSLCFLTQLQGKPWKKIKLYVPEANGKQVLADVDQLLFGNRDRFGMTFDVIAYKPEDALDIGTLRVTFQQTRHPGPCYSPRVTNGTKTLVYTADTGYYDELITHAQHADLLICESTFAYENDMTTDHGHLTGTQAGQIAAQASVHRLILTHFGTSRADQARNWTSAKAAFPGAVDLASTEAVYLI
ncbi:beta-lactamase [Paenibacillus terrae HPL-003]|uniref:Beta-lactamase n=1 Tax=Paenibacillus terrae (strain HPL-003) TaxID=985665 RepID=G7VPQ8_PAETH|nr:MBL fold metallo-hydrolase [Paenibacillus terrae]AET61056.1 beta-lactamase [Paenibacillus terrae HPL-003]